MLLDTNIVGYFFRDDTRARLYELQLTGRHRYIAFVTLGELYRWLFLRPFTDKTRERLFAHIASYTVVPVDDKVAWIWAELTAASRKSGKSISTTDAWIAATALRHNFPLVTHNRRHFESIQGLTVISESLCD